jgi:hypothetical protein
MPFDPRGEIVGHPDVQPVVATTEDVDDDHTDDDGTYGRCKVGERSPTDRNCAGDPLSMSEPMGSWRLACTIAMSEQMVREKWSVGAGV